MNEDSTRTVAAAGSGGEPIGPYRLLQRLGEGGMGEVWLAEQAQPIRRKVALKLIKAGMDTRQVIARFEAERQALALMEHPGIAKVFEAGETSKGHPYFVMEYVQGEPITSYCDRQRLTTGERLELVATVCDGVQHAHQKGIIHRDLKPSNVLVTLQGAKPVPKIIDFGVAKATAQRLTEHTMYTELGGLVGTPEYMSPEQAEMTGIDVDTRTDVYALGVILYELLTGALPFDSKDLRAASVDEIRRRIREVDPPRPSTRVGTLGDRATDSARRQQTDPGKLVSRLRGDLDWITMKALEKDRTRRYGSPSELAADIERHLAHQPVLAGPPSSAYRARKFVRRHRVGVTAAALAVVALLGFGVSMAVQAQRIARERNRAERVSEFLTGLFKESDPSEARGNAITAREILDRGAEKIETELGSEPQVQAHLLLTLGNVYKSLALHAKAEPLLARSLEIRQRTLGDEHADTLASMFDMAWLRERQGRYEEAEALQRSTLEGRRRTLGREHPATLSSMSALAVALERQGEYDEAEALYREALEARRRVLGSDHIDTIWSIHNVGWMEQIRGRYDDAEALLREAAEAMRRKLGPDHPDTLWVINNLANVYNDLGRYEEAEKLHRETLAARRRVFGDLHPRTVASMNNLASTLWTLGRLTEARKTFTEVLETNRQLLGADHRSTISAMNNLAGATYELGDKRAAEMLYREALEISRRSLGVDHPDTLQYMASLGDVYLRDGRFDEAETLLDESLAGLRRVVGDDHPDLAYPLYSLGALAAVRGQRAQALDWLGQAVEHGLSDPASMVEDETLASLRGDPAFEDLLSGTRKDAGD